jgi:hypothetical protein
LSPTELESLASRIRIAAAPQSAAGGAHRMVWSARFRTITLRLDRQSWIPQPLLPLTSLSAR